MIGTVVDKYEVLQKIGEGGMATVYRGRHVTLGRDVAIKVLHPHLSASTRNRQRFSREARAIEQLDHDNILKIFDYSGVNAEDCYIVTEFVDGLTLHQLIQDRGRVPSEVAAIVGLELARALAYAHKLGIIHRDIKPENVMLRRDGTIKLMDFGIARFIDDAQLTVTGALVGSPAYMSPEQAMEHVLDWRSDLFSLGTLLYHLVTGQLPFTGSNPSIVLRNIIEGRRPGVLELAPDVSGTLADLIEKLMQTDPGDRPATSQDVQDRLLAVLAEVRIEARAPAWGLQGFLADPADYEKRLRDHLLVTLPELGKERTAARDYLAALRLFNRLLSLDENNAEVLALVQGMHAEKSGPTIHDGTLEVSPADGASVASETRKAKGIGGALLLLLASAALAWALWPPTPPSPVPSGTAALIEPQESPTSTEGPGEPAPVMATSIEPLPPPTAVPPQTAPPPPADPPKVPHVSAHKLSPEELIPPVVEKATLAVTVNGWANITVDKLPPQKTGQMGKIELEPGPHTIVVQNDYSEPYSTTVNLVPGANPPLNVVLKPLPAKLQIAHDFAGDCVLKLNGVTQGTLSGLSYVVTVDAHSPPPHVDILCAGADPAAFDIQVLQPGQVFPIRKR